MKHSPCLPPVGVMGIGPTPSDRMQMALDLCVRPPHAISLFGLGPADMSASMLDPDIPPRSRAMPPSFRASLSGSHLSGPIRADAPHLSWNDRGRSVRHPSSFPAVRVLDIGPASSGFVQMVRDARARSFPLLSALAMALLIAGCTEFPNVGTDVATTGMPNTEIALRDSMRLVDAEMGKLGGLAPAPAPSAAAGPVVPGELQKVVTFTWAGSLEDGVRQLADNVGYAVVPAPPGQAPAAVSVTTGPVPVIQAFQALGDAAGARATVRVDPARRQVEVLYHA